MNIIVLLIPLGLLLLGIAVWAFLWAVNHDQFEDLDRAGQSILFDDDEAAHQRAARGRTSGPEAGSAAEAAGEATKEAADEPTAG